MLVSISLLLWYFINFAKCSKVRFLCVILIVYFSAKVYLDLNRSIDELYYEKYDNVAVMFASLTDYKLGIEDDDETNDKIFLRILDEVISDFDRVSIYIHTHIPTVHGGKYCTPLRKDTFDAGV